MLLCDCPSVTFVLKTYSTVSKRSAALCRPRSGATRSVTDISSPWKNPPAVNFMLAAGAYSWGHKRATLALILFHRRTRSCPADLRCKSFVNPLQAQLLEDNWQYGKNRKMPVHLSLLRLDCMNRADDGSTLVMTQSSRPNDARYVSAVLWMAQK